MDPLSATASISTIISGLICVVGLIKKYDGEVEKLENPIRDAWKILDKVVDSLLHGNHSSDFEGPAQNLMKWCYDAEDFRDYRMYEIGNLGILLSAKDFLRGFFHITDVKRLLANLHVIETQWNGITCETPTTETIKTERPSELIGRDKDLEDIVRGLTQCGDDDKFSFSIIGMSGLGKSSLAESIYDHANIDNQFPCKLWIPLSDGIFVWDIIKTKIDEKLQAYESSTNNQHCEDLLIVFDNLFDVKHMAWNQLVKYIKGKNLKRFRMIITTYNQEIPQITNTTPHILEPLSPDSCERVIIENAQLYEVDLSGSHYSELVKLIAKRCEGFPLVAEFFGIILGKCKDDKEREAIWRERRLWHMAKFKSEILPILKRSYSHMGSGLRRCFAYLSLFPVGHQFITDDLVYLFVGECFHISSGPTPSLKKFGEECLTKLNQRLILKLSPSSTSYQMHNFVPEFAKRAALGTCMLLDDESSISCLSDKIRHLSLLCDFNDQIRRQLKKCKSILKKLRTFLSLYCEHHRGNLGEISWLPKKAQLRVLSLKYTDVKDLSAFMDNLKRLRYLDVSSTKVKRLPPTLYKNGVLQFLKIKESFLSTFPPSFQKSTTLRYVDWDDKFLRENMPCHIGKFSLLESLPLFCIGQEDGYHISELKDLDKLQGFIRIENLEHVETRKEAEEAKLKDKCDLESIELQWELLCNRDNPPSDEDNPPDEDILAGLQPHDNVKELALINYWSNNLPNWISISGIEKLTLTGCRSCYFPALAKMQKLKFLALEDMGDIITVCCRADNDADAALCFPQLESLKFENMTDLREWASRLHEEDMPHLRKLRFINCPNLNLGIVNDLSQRISSLSEFGV